MNGETVYSHGPMYKSSEVKDGKIVVTFDNSGSLSIMPSSQYTDTTGEQKIPDGEFDPDVLNEFELVKGRQITLASGGKGSDSDSD